MLLCHTCRVECPGDGCACLSTAAAHAWVEANGWIAASLLEESKCAGRERETCIGLFRSGAAPRAGGRPSCLTVKNWEGLAMHWVLHTAWSGSLGLGMRDVSQGPATVHRTVAAACSEVPSGAPSCSESFVQAPPSLTSHFVAQGPKELAQDKLYLLCLAVGRRPGPSGSCSPAAAGVLVCAETTGPLGSGSRL